MNQLSLSPLVYRPLGPPPRPSILPPRAYQAPPDEGRSFYSVDVVVADALHDQVCGQDQVELSEGAFHLVTNHDYPAVAGLRLPPRFPSQAQVAAFRGQVLRNGRQ